MERAGWEFGLKSSIEKSGRKQGVAQEKGREKGEGNERIEKDLRQRPWRLALISCLIKQTRKCGPASCRGKKPTYCETQSFHRTALATKETKLPSFFLASPLAVLGHLTNEYRRWILQYTSAWSRWFSRFLLYLYV